MKHVFLGSTAERVVRHSPCPVPAVQKKRQSKTGPRLTVKRILVPGGFFRAVRRKVSNTRSGSPINFEPGSCCFMPHISNTSIRARAQRSMMSAGLQNAARENAERQMQKLVRAAKFGRVKYEIAFTDGSPVLDICAFAKRTQCRCDHYLDTRLDRFRTCLNRKHRRESGATCALFRFGCPIASSDKIGKPRKNRRT